MNTVVPCFQDDNLPPKKTTICNNILGLSRDIFGAYRSHELNSRREHVDATEMFQLEGSNTIREQLYRYFLP